MAGSHACTLYFYALIYVNNLRVEMLQLIWITVGQEPTVHVFSVGAGGAVWSILLSFIISHFFLPLFGRRHDIDLHTV